MKRLLTALVCFIVSGNCLAQVPKPPVNMPSPTAFSFQQYGNFNGTSFTGAVPISVPLYNLEYKSLNFPFVLNYISTGVKVDQVPGWAGVNMNLNIGGVITRQVKGLTDEFWFELAPGSAYVNGGQFHNGYFFNNPVTTFFYNEIRKISQPFYKTNISGNQTAVKRVPQRPLPYKGMNHQHEKDIYWAGNDDYAGIAASYSNWQRDGIKDYLPDEFNFNFLDFTGTFRFISENVIEVKSSRNLKIERISGYSIVPFTPFPASNNNTAGSDVEYSGWSPWVHAGNYPKTISGFKITDDRGYIYYFGKYDATVTNPTHEYFNGVPIEYSISHQNRATDYWKADAWYLARIECPDGKAIDLEYERGALINSSFNSGFTRLAATNNPTANIPSLSSDQDLKSPVYLKSIRSELLSADFYRETTQPLKVVDYGMQSYITGNNSQRLSRVTIKPYNHRQINYQFNYDYDTCNRWFLKSLVQYAPTSTDSFAYRFEYTDIAKLPPLQSYKTDHWGYFNNTSTLGASPTLFYSLKQTNPAVNQYGALTRLIYPTGGSTEFEYETNQVLKFVQDKSYSGVDNFPDVMNAGGLRIKRIFSNDGINERRLVKEYFYTTAYDRNQADNPSYNPPSSGVLSYNPKYSWATTILNADKLTVYNYGIFHSLAQNIPLKIFTSNPVNALMDDNPVSYSQIVERNPDKSYTIFKYTDAASNPDEAPVDGYTNFIESPFYKASSKSLERGYIKQSSMYDNMGNLVKDIQNTMDADYRNADGSLPCDTIYDAQSLEAKEDISYLEGDHYFFVTGTAYKKYKYNYVTRVNSEWNYDRNNVFMDIHTYTFRDNPLHRQVTRVVTTNSNGDTLKTYTKYAQDYNTGNYLIQRMVNKGFTTSPIETIRTIIKSGTNTELVLSAELSQYNLRPNYSQDFLLSSLWVLNPAEPFPLHTMIVTQPGNNIDWGGSWVKDSRYKLQTAFDVYDDNKNALEFIDKGNFKSAVLYNKANTQVVMTAVNCPDARRLGYTSFESSESDRNWSMQFMQYDSVNTKTGYKSGIGTAIFTSATGTLYAGLRNVSVEIWVKAGGAMPTLQYQMYSATSEWINFLQPAELLKTESGWNLYRFRHTYSGPTYAIKINSNGNNIDEIRIYPSDSQKTMIQTSCYSEEGILMASSDVNNNITYYEYDAFGRLKCVRDSDKNIIKIMEYKANTGILQ